MYIRVRKFRIGGCMSNVIQHIFWWWFQVEKSECLLTYKQTSKLIYYDSFIFFVDLLHKNKSFFFFTKKKRAIFFYFTIKVITLMGLLGLSCGSSWAFSYLEAMGFLISQVSISFSIDQKKKKKHLLSCILFFGQSVILVLYICARFQSSLLSFLFHNFSPTSFQKISLFGSPINVSPSYC